MSRKETILSLYPTHTHIEHTHMEDSALLLYHHSQNGDERANEHAGKCSAAGIGVACDGRL